MQDPKSFQYGTQAKARDFYRKIHKPAISARLRNEKDVRKAAESLALCFFSFAQLAVTKF